MKVNINQLLSTNYSKDKQFENRMLQRDNCLVGWVDSYNSENHTINVQPAIQSEIVTSQQTTMLKNKPFLINCPVISNTLSRVPQKGDKALILVLDEKSNNFFKTAFDTNKPIEQQTLVNQSKAYKTLSNCVAFVINPNPVEGGGGSTSLNSLKFEPSNAGLQYQDGKATATGNFIYTTTESDTPASIIGSIQNNIIGGDGIIVDADETSTNLEIHLDSNVLTTEPQTFTLSEQEQVRQNIGAGTSDFSGDYNDLTNLPDIPDSGITQIVGTDDNPITVSRLRSEIQQGKYTILSGVGLNDIDLVAIYQYLVITNSAVGDSPRNLFVLGVNKRVGGDYEPGSGIGIISLLSNDTVVIHIEKGLRSLNGNDWDYNYPTPNIYAPLTSGTAGQFLQSNGSNNAPTWVNKNTVDARVIDSSIISEISNTTDGIVLQKGVGAGSINYQTATYKVDGIDFAVERPNINTTEQMAFLSDIPSIVNASTAEAGIIQIATNSEAEIGTNTSKAITPNQLKTAIDGLGTVFDLKGSVQSVSNLPITNNQIGDVWYVIDESVGYIWLNDGTTNRWEQLGSSINLSNYIEFSDVINSLTSTEIDKPLSAYQGNILQTSINQINSNINTLQSNISAKSSTYINNELSDLYFTSNPQTQITTNTNAISNETTNRINADNNIQNIINGLVTGVSSVAGYTGAVSATQLINAILTGADNFGNKILLHSMGSTSGYLVLNSGLKMQWGRANHGSVAFDWTINISYSTVGFMNIPVILSTPIETSGNGCYSYVKGTPTTTGATLRQTSKAGAGGKAQYLYWIAIGY